MEKITVTEEMREERRQFIEKQTNGMMFERQTTNPLVNQLQFGHGYFYLQNRLINGADGSSLEIAFFSYDGISKEDLLLHYIGVNDSERNNGVATKAMSLLCDVSDLYEYNIKLVVSDKFGSDTKRLVEFYKRFGFEIITDKYDTEDVMYRKFK